MSEPPELASSFAGVARLGRHGRRGGDAGVVISEVRCQGLASIVARKGCRTALGDAARAQFGVELPAAARRQQAGGMALVWSGPDRWLACTYPLPQAGMEAHLGAAFRGLAAIVELSHAALLLRASGPRVRDAFAKGLPIDLHPCAFMTGHSAMTAIAHISVHLWQIDEQPTYELLVPRGYGESFWHWLAASCGEFGLELAALAS